ncbi:hypothetical protein JCM16303_004471 [Sporobolomyces ruberrimus]
MIPELLLVKKFSKEQLAPSFISGKEENGAVEKVWKESELKALSFMNHVRSEGWTIAIEVLLDDKYWNSTMLKEVCRECYTKLFSQQGDYSI